MGERDPGLAPPPPAPPWPQRALLAVCLLALLVAVLWLGPLPPGPEAGAPALVTSLLEKVATAVAGTRGPGILGVLMLALAAAVACPSLERRVGPGAPLLLTLLLFGSGCWALVFSGGAALVALALAAAAFALAYGRGEEEAPAEIYLPPESGWRGTARWLGVGLLLAELVPGSPLAATLLVPAGLATPRHRRSWLLPALLVGFAAGLGLEILVRGTEILIEPAALAVRTFSLDPLLVGRGLLGMAVGRNVGLLLGFAPILLLPLTGRGAAARPGLAAVCLAAPVLAVLLWPLDFAAGWLLLAFLPFYGALWHLPFVAPRPWQWMAVVVLAAFASWPLWASPRAALAGDGAGLGASWPRRQLPYELTLRRLPNRGEAWVAGERVRVRAVAGCRLLGDPGRFEMLGAGPATLWIAAPVELGMVALELGPGAPSSFEVTGAVAGRTVFRPDGRVGFEVLLSEPRAQHRLWFDERPLAIHLIELRLPVDEDARPPRFRLLAAVQP